MSKEKKGAQVIRCVKKTSQGLEVVYPSEKTVRNSKFMEKYDIRVEDESFNPSQNKAAVKTNAGFREMSDEAPDFAAVKKTRNAKA